MGPHSADISDADGDDDLERITTNNPAMTAPVGLVRSRASDTARSFNNRNQSQYRKESSKGGSAATGHDGTAHSNVLLTSKDVPDPAGNAETVNESNERVTNHFISKYERGWRRVVRNFSPSWFSTTMGTGIVTLLLVTIPFQATWLYWLSVVFFVLNTMLFSAAFFISLLRYSLYPEIWMVMIRDPTNSLFLGTVPMGFATLVESWYILCCPYWGDWAVVLAWVAWMVDSIAAFAVTVSLMFLLMSESHQNQLDRITAAQLLPIAATIVAAGAGAEAAELLMGIGRLDNALGTLITSYVMWGMATPFAMAVLVMYYQRLALHKLPPREIIVSSFLPLGPLGMGGYAIFYAGKVARELLPQVELLGQVSIAGDVLYVVGMLIALIMWGFGVVWMLFALATIWSARPFPFNMGWWGFTFPLGVFSLSTITFGTEMPSMFFKVLGTIFSVSVILLWCIVAVGTLKGAWSGRLFHAPCLRNLPKRKKKEMVTGGSNDANSTVNPSQPV